MGRRSDGRRKGGRGGCDFFDNGRVLRRWEGFLRFSGFEERIIHHLRFVESKTWTYVPRAGRVGAAHDGAARRGGAGQDGTPTDLFAQETTVLRISKASSTRVLNVFSEARTSEILCKPMEEKYAFDPRLASG